MDEFNIDMSFTKLNRVIPKSIIIEFGISAFPESIREWGEKLIHNTWRFVIVQQTRGYCRYASRIITIPEWAVNRKAQAKQPGYIVWYLSHEMAHAFDMGIHAHGPEFMEWLKRICPNEFIHYELGYKPRNAASAGITMKGVVPQLTKKNMDLGFD